MDSEFWMDRALSLARRGKGTAPNPAVGAVLVKNDRLIGEGFHRGPGHAHAEAAALDDARSRGHEPNGSTLYVTLEPCCHEGQTKRTPPCAQRLIAEGIKAVWAAVEDPNPLVSGAGRDLLVRSGIAFHWGPRTEEARELIADFSTWMIRKRPFITLKWAQSLDGQMTGPPGTSWITGPVARFEAHHQRSEHDAVAVGAGTVRADNPALTVRSVPVGAAGQPRRLVFAGSKPLPADAKVFTDEYRENSWVVCSPSSPTWAQAEALVDGRIIAWNGSEPNELGEHLLKAGFFRIFVEGGPRLLQSFFGWKLWDRIEVFTAPVLFATQPIDMVNPRWKILGQDSLLEAWNPAVVCSQD